MPSVKLTAEPQKYRKGQKSRPPQDMPFDVAMRKFKKGVEAAGVLQDVKRKEYYEKPTWKRKRKKAEALARTKRQQQANDMGPNGRRRMY